MTESVSASAVRSGTGSPREDAATKSAREELKQTVISEKTTCRKEEDSSTRRAATPDQDEAIREQVSSPKKKRAHAELDKDDEETKACGNKKNKDEQAGSSDEHNDSTDGGSKAGSAGTTLLEAPVGTKLREKEPEKKRVRDEETSTNLPSADDSQEDKPATSAPKASSTFASSGFAKLTSSTSPFGSLGTDAGAGAKPALFGSSSGPTSPFGTLGSASAAAAKPATASTTPALPPAPTLSFGSSSASPFATLQQPGTSKSGFGSGFGALATSGGRTGLGSFGGSFGGGGAATGSGTQSAFGGALTSAGLPSFAKPGASFQSGKPARPFGAPDSGEEEGSADEDSAAEEDEDSNENEGAAGEDDDGEAADESGTAKGGATDDKKKQRLQRVAVDDGEAGEATLLQVRARLYYLDKNLSGWKERGAGMLKINVPEQCVEFDGDGIVIPASFDASTLGENADNGNIDTEEDGGDDTGGQDAGRESKNGHAPEAKSKVDVAPRPKREVVRLIMRQDSTHRVILNTAVLTTTEFKERQTLKATTVLFTAFEGNDAKPVNMQAKMSIPNAKALIAALNGIQRELRGD
ncbi:hypothetical protein SEPCBS119000_003459 [Sporothrix epigloea]|uniref:RanBD1 domain-containing protein n=1 Tax=Sporothrix epigloea TaxID=1892477 RepID=A0ABP0DQZ1_9PEZI